MRAKAVLGSDNCKYDRNNVSGYSNANSSFSLS